MAKAKHNGHLQLDPKNARRHSPRNQALIRQSLETVGAGRSILADANGIVRAGNGVFEQAQALGIPVKVVESDGKQLIAVKRTDLRGKAAVRAAMLDNLAADSSYADYDSEILASIVKDDELIASLAREDKAISALLAKAEPQAEPVDAGELLDKGKALAEKWGTATGQIWTLGQHRIGIGDCTDAEIVKSVMGNDKGDLLWTDPPYHVGKEFADGYDEGKQWDALLQTEWLGAAMAFLKPSAQRYICFAQARSRDAILTYEPKRLLVWCKPFALMRSNSWDWAYEFVAWCYDGDEPNYFNKPNGTLAFDWQEIASVIHGHEGKWHITQKPIALPQRHISASCPPRGIVLDMFLGSGTTLLACDALSMKCRGIERSTEYAAVTLERWHNQTGGVPRLANLGLTPRPVRMGDGEAR